MKLKYSRFISVGLAIFLLSGIFAEAASLNGKALSAVDDVMSATGAPRVLKKDSLFIVTHDYEAQGLECSYVAFGEDNKPEAEVVLLKRGEGGNGAYNGQSGAFVDMFPKGTRALSGLHPAISTNYFDSSVPPLFVINGLVSNSSPTYDALVFDIMDKSVVGGASAKSTESVSGFGLYDKDVSGFKGGIFAPGSDKEIFAGVEWVEHMTYRQAILDFYSVPKISARPAQGKKGTSSIKKEASTYVSGSANTEAALAKIAVGDLNNDGSPNEIALIHNAPDAWGFYLSVYQVTWEGSTLKVNTLVDSTIINSNTLYNSVNNDRDEWFQKAAGDVAIGDFDGDGRNEIAAVYKGYNEDIPDLHGRSELRNACGSLHVKIYKWNSNERKFIEGDNVAVSVTSSSTTKESSKYNLSSLGNLMAVAADVDGDGKSELAILKINFSTIFTSYTIDTDKIQRGTWSSCLDLWRLDSSKDNKVKMKRDKEIANLGNFYSDDTEENLKELRTNFNRINGSALLGLHCFTDQAFQMTAGNFTGMTNAETNRPCYSIAVSCSSYINYASNRWVKVVYPVYKNNSLSFENVVVKTINNKFSVGLGAGDFKGDGIFLKNPVHSVTVGNQVPTTIIQAPPYHVDYIPLPWEKDGKAKLANISFVPATQVKYVRSTSAQNQKDISSSSSHQTDIKLDGTFSYSAGIPFVPAVDDKFPLKHSVMVQAQANFSGKWASSELEKNSDTTKTTISMGSGRKDSLMAYQTKYHVWSYPIDPVPEWYKTAAKTSMDVSKLQKIQYSVTMTEQPGLYQGDLESYNAKHEEGNLFSYPTTLNAITDLNNPNSQILSETVTRRFGPSELEYTLNIDKSITKGETANRDINAGGGLDFTYMYGNAKLGATGVSAHFGVAYKYNTSNTKSLTKTYTKGDALSVKFPDPAKAEKAGLAGSIEDVTYGTTFQAYSNPQGLLKLAFAVDLSSGGSVLPLLWRESIYNEKPDPSFVLPNKFTLLGGKWKVNSDMLRATEMRGTIYKDSGKDTMTNPFFESGKTYDISLPIYNASFVNVPAFTVRLSYIPYSDRKDLSKLQKIGEVTINGLSAWTSGSENNKTYANFNWTVPSNLKSDNYLLWAEIDPDNKVNEVHEAWSVDLPGGNNTGYVMIPVRTLKEVENAMSGGNSKKLNASNFKTRRRLWKSNAKAASLADDEDGEWAYYDDSRALYDYITAQSDDVEIEFLLDYAGDSALGDVSIELLQTLKDDDGEEITYAYDSDSYYFDNEESAEFYAVISPDELKDGGDLLLIVTAGDEELEFPLASAPSKSGTDDIEEEQNNSETAGGSGGGCEIGVSVFAFALALSLLTLKRKTL
ncbi:MAG: hypothetical protein IJ859_00530 [Synergistaceae bacterium]|nr:hypothetical protein [Synergistaceae bacterium]